MFHHCYVCGTSQSAFRQKCKFCSHELQDSWLYKFLRWCGKVVGLLVHVALVYAVALSIASETAAAAAGVAIICTHLVLSHKIAKMEKRLAKLECPKNTANKT